ncbi:MAG TPA: sugar ABC transporter permease [Anaerolineae bacterium]
MKRTRGISPAWLFAAPALFLLIVFLIYPTLWTVRLAFYGGPGFIPTKFVWFENFTRLFTTDPYFLNTATFPPSGTVINNLIWLFVFVPLVVGLGLVIAVLAEKVRYESFVKSIVFLPFGISATAAGVIWLFVYSSNPRVGLINAIMSALDSGWQSIAFTGDTHWITFAIIIAAVWIQTGFVTVILSAALKGISQDVIEASRVDGANALQVFLNIQVPMISTTLGVVIVTMIIFVIKVFDLILVVGGENGGPQGSARVLAFTQFVETFHNGRGGYGSAIAVIMMLLILPIMVINVRRFRQEESLR